MIVGPEGVVDARVPSSVGTDNVVCGGDGGGDEEEQGGDDY